MIYYYTFMRMLFCFLILVLTHPSWGQMDPATLCSHNKRGHHHQIPEIGSLLENNYDVKYMKIDLAVDNQHIQISGNVTTRIEVLANDFNQYVFELNRSYTIDSILVEGVLNSNYVDENDDLITVNLPQTYQVGDTLSIQVFYHGSTTNTIEGYSKGVYSQTSFFWQNRVTYSLTQPFSAKNWIPCKQSLQDKIEEVDIWLTVREGLKAGSNGLLQNITTLPDGKKRFEWHTDYPIEYYLLAFAVSDYDEYNIKAYLPDSQDSLLIQNYIYSNPAFLQSNKANIDSVALMVTYFSELFGDYKFKNEKYGHMMAPFSGGMEHQTMTTQGYFFTGLSAHELGHQWFGNSVTCASWADMWLNEGFATYASVLFKERFHSLQAAQLEMRDYHTNITSQVGGALYIIDSLNENRIFDSRLTYKKGAAVVHMLRYLINDDDVFFSMLKQYQVDFENQTIDTEGFKAYVEAYANISLDEFFEQWVYKEGYPTYSGQYNKVNDTLYIKLNQTTSHPSVSFFRMPIEFEISDGLGSSQVVRFENTEQGQVFKLYHPSPVAEVTIDPDIWILKTTGPVTLDETLSIADRSVKDITILPNPTNRFCELKSEGAAISAYQIVNLKGEVMKQQQFEGARNSFLIDFDEVASGAYIIHLVNIKGERLIKKIVVK